MNPKVLVSILALLNLATGVGLGVALDRYVLPAATNTDASAQKGARGDRRGKKGRGNRRDHMQRRMKHLTQELGLDDKQVPLVQAVFEARRPKFMAVFAEVRPRLEALEKNTHADLLAILRPEQQTKLEELRKSHEGRGPPWGRGRGRRGKRPGQEKKQ